MPNHIRLFERPLVADEVQPALMVTGMLPGYTAGDAYEGRLPILNSIGKCTVEVLESTLPPGAFVRVDNITKEAVVKWSAYKEEEESISLVPGGDFEDGDAGSWSLGNGWSIGSGPDYDVKSGSYSARFAGVKTKGSDMVSPRVPAKVNDYIRVTAQVQQGASAKGNAGARVSLIYRNAEGAELLRLWGNLASSGSGGAWNASTAEGAAPADTATVEVVISAYRNRENFALWVDDVVWNHKYTLGQESDDGYFLYLKVTDSLNRVAYWKGNIEEYGVFLTSTPYQYEQPYEAYVPTLAVTGLSLRVPPTAEALDAYVPQLAVTGVTLRDIQRSITAPSDAYTPSLAVASITLRTVQRGITIEPDAYAPALAVTGLSLRKVLIQQTQPVEAYTPTLAVTGVTLT